MLSSLLFEDPEYPHWAVKKTPRYFIAISYYLLTLRLSEVVFVLVQDLSHVICAFEMNTQITPEGVARVADDSHTFYEVHRSSIFYSLEFYLNRIHSVLDVCTRLCEKTFSISYVSVYSIRSDPSPPSPPIPLVVINENFITLDFNSLSLSLLAFSRKSVSLWCFPPTALISQGQVPLCYSSAGASVPSKNHNWRKQ